MIISASRRTDIPAFYSQWFMNRIQDGWFESVNPFNCSQVRTVSLLSKDVDVIVFWSKNPAPMLKRLGELDAMGYKYYFQYTLNDYPAFVEPGIPSLSERLETFLKLSRQLGSRRVVWRYDPIIIANRTPVEYHLESFANIAEKLAGECERVVISFLDFYAKLEGRMKNLQKSKGFNTYDITLPEYKDDLVRLVSGLGGIAKSRGMKIYSCSEELDLTEWGVMHGSCIDAALIKDVFNLELNCKKDRNQRKGCLCAPSVDMGVYNTCSHACSYCYANRSETYVYGNRQKYNPESPALCR